MSKLASRAEVCYNQKVNIVVPGNAANISRLVANLYRRSTTVNTLPSSASNGNPEKRCTACNNSFPATLEFFHHSKLGKYNLRSTCKQCKAEGKHPIKLPPDEYKRCTGICGRVLPNTSEFFHCNRNTLLSSCKQCRSASSKIYKKEHCEEMREYGKQYKENHREILQEKHKQRRKDHGEEIRERERQYDRDNCDRRREIARRYRQSERGKALCRIKHSNRRARKQNAIGTYTAKQIQEQYARQKGKCYYCQHKVKWGEHHVEHVIPLSRGGSNDISNIVIACPTCNLRKNDKLPHEWPQGGRLL